MKPKRRISTCFVLILFFSKIASPPWVFLYGIEVFNNPLQNGKEIFKTATIKFLTMNFKPNYTEIKKGNVI